MRRLDRARESLLERLVANVTTAGRPDHIREASLEALGYICQDIVSRRDDFDRWRRREKNDVVAFV